jgi:hypothetical protein
MHGNYIQALNANPNIMSVIQAISLYDEATNKSSFVGIPGKWGLLFQIIY